MPNWCSNFVELSHEDPAMIKRAYDALERQEFLQEFIPVPEELKNTIAGGYGDEDKQAELVAQTKRNVAKYGYGNWYDFCCGEWGTKWDVGDQGANDIHPDGLMLTASFDSAWSPPVEAYNKLLDLGFQVRAYYYESGMCFAGVYDNGDDDSYDFTDMSPDEIEASIPSELDEMFGIVETMREFQDDSEELTEWIKEGVEARKEAK